MTERDFEMESKEHEARAWLWETRCREMAAQVTRAASFGALTDHPEARELYAMARYTLAQEKRA